MSQLGVAPKGMAGRPVMEPPAGHAPQWLTSDSGEAEKKNIETTTAMYAAWEKNDAKGFEALIADDVSWTEFFQPKDAPKGKATAKKQLADFQKAFGDLKLERKNVWAAGDLVFVETAMTATFKGPLGPIKPTKKTGTTHGFDVVQVKDGKLANGWSYGSSAEFAGAFGLIPKDAGRPPAPKAGPKMPPGGMKAHTPLPPPGLPPGPVKAGPPGGAKPAAPPTAPKPGAPVGPVAPKK
jgi:ketosteroid isomerase-like protein